MAVLASILIPSSAAALNLPDAGAGKDGIFWWYFLGLFYTPVEPIDICRYCDSIAVEIQYHCAAFEAQFEKYQDSKEVWLVVMLAVC